MTFDYASLRDDVVEPIIAEFGRSATLTQPGASTGDEWDPTPGTPTTYAVKVLVVSLTAADRAGALVREDDRKYLMSTDNDPAPDLEGTLKIGSDTFQVYKLEPKSPGDTVLFWYVFCRK